MVVADGVAVTVGVTVGSEEGARVGVNVLVGRLDGTLFTFVGVASLSSLSFLIAGSILVSVGDGASEIDFGGVINGVARQPAVDIPNNKTLVNKNRKSRSICCVPLRGWLNFGHPTEGVYL
jgi:hypothetical protein